MSKHAVATLTLDDVVRALRIATYDSPDSAFVIDRDGIFVMANHALCQSLGVEESTLIGRRFDLSARASSRRSAPRVRALPRATGARACAPTASPSSPR